jgi:3-oxoacyl-[acyl-carrier protein] reductase
MTDESALNFLEERHRLAFVTGASRGIGRACAIELARQGWQVVASGRDEAMLLETVTQCRNLGANADGVRTDICDVASVTSAITSTEHTLGPIGLLVNSAGIDNSRPLFLEVTEHDWDVALDTNLKGLFFCTQAVVAAMLPRGSGQIINISSIVGFMGGWLPYTITKWGVEGFTKSLARELTPKGIRVNAVAPGVTATQMTGFSDDGPIEHDSFPLGRVASPEDIARVVAFLASDSAAYMSGSTVIVDGGLLTSR